MRSSQSDDVTDPGERARYAAEAMREELDFEYAALYTLVWALRGRFGEGTDEHYLPDAVAALDSVLAENSGVLRRAVWRKGPHGPALARADLEPSWFAAPDDTTEEYVVVDSRVDRTGG